MKRWGRRVDGRAYETPRAGDAASRAAGRSQQAAARQGRRGARRARLRAARRRPTSFEAHALIDGDGGGDGVASGRARALPAAARRWACRSIASLSSRQAARRRRSRDHIGADAFVLRPYKKEMISIALYRGGQRAAAARAGAARGAGAGRRDAACARRDSTSGMLHIDLFKTLLPLEIRRARRHGYPIAICVVSIDPLPNAQRRDGGAGDGVRAARCAARCATSTWRCATATGASWCSCRTPICAAPRRSGGASSARSATAGCAPGGVEHDPDGVGGHRHAAAGQAALVRAPDSRRARGGQGGAAQRRRSRGRAS